MTLRTRGASSCNRSGSPFVSLTIFFFDSTRAVTLNSATAQTWRNKLQEICEAKFLSVSRLQDDCPVLASLQSTDLELPGQHQNLAEYSSEHCVYLEMVSSNAVVLRRHCVTLRRIQLICSDGRSRYFTVHCGQPHGLHGTDERIVSVHRCDTLPLPCLPAWRVVTRCTRYSVLPFSVLPATSSARRVMKRHTRFPVLRLFVGKVDGETMNPRGLVPTIG